MTSPSVLSMTDITQAHCIRQISKATAAGQYFVCLNSHHHHHHHHHYFLAHKQTVQHSASTDNVPK